MLFNFLTDYPVKFDSEKAKVIDTIGRCRDADCLRYKPLKPYVNLFKVVPEYHISYCAVQGVYEYMAENMFCYLYDTDYFVENNVTFDMNHPIERPCWRRNELDFVIDVDIHLSHEVNHLFLYQEPFLRFTIAYINECIMKDVPEYCFHCSKFDLTCFAMKLNYLVMYPPKLDYNDNNALMFLKVAPQTWYCDIRNTYRNTTFIQYGISKSERETTINQIYDFLSDKVPKQKADHIREVLQKERKSAWFGEWIGRRYIDTILHNALLNDKSLEYLLTQIYKTDIELLDFKEYGPKYVHRVLTEKY